MCVLLHFYIILTYRNITVKYTYISSEMVNPANLTIYYNNKLKRLRYTLSNTNSGTKKAKTICI